MARELVLTRGYVALVDDDDFDWLSQRSWCAWVGRTGNAYAIGRVSGRICRMHRVILSAPDCAIVDHINANGVDNRRQNLRLCSPSENSRNRRTNRGTATGLKGVEAMPYERFRAALWVGDKRRHLGTFSDPVEAARAYDRAALAEYGEFARLNFPDEAA